jgi:LemA protein
MAGIGLLLVAAVLLWGVASYRRLVRMRAKLTADWRLIKQQLGRRHILVLRLIEAVQGPMVFEMDALGGLIDAHERALTIAGPAEAARREEELSAAIEKLVAAIPGYPALQAQREVVGIRRDLAALDKQIRVAQRAYNDAAGQFNAAQRVFPFSLLAGQLGLRTAEGFEAASAALLLLASLLSLAALRAEAPSGPAGFSSPAASTEIALEQRFKDVGRFRHADR